MAAIGFRTTAIAVVPLAGFLAIAAMALLDRHNVQQEMQQLTEDAVVIQTTGYLVHEIQKERGITAVYLTSGGKLMVEEMAAQRRAVDGRWSELRSVAGGAAGIDKVAEVADALATLRASADARGVTTSAATEAFGKASMCCWVLPVALSQASSSDLAGS
jgi:Nitrate and nitrite sensing.